MSPRQIVASVLAVFALIVLIFCASNIWTNLDAKQIMVIQAPWSGALTWEQDQGMKWLLFGHPTRYDRRSQFWFSVKSDQGKTNDESIKIRFNDGGHANISGGISWDMPTDPEHLTLLHRKYNSQAAIEQQLVRTMVEKSIYMTGPIMSSKESYAERRNELLHLIEDQIQNGVYLTKTTSEKAADAITGAEKTIAHVEILQDEKTHLPLRAEESALKEFGIKVFNLSINEINYDEAVEAQIKQQQQLTMQVQTAIATAKQAEQETLTAKQQGMANAAKAEWEQKTVAAKEIAKAEQEKTVAETAAKQKLAVAELDAQAALQFKQAETSRGEGEAARRKLVMAADGALEKKLETYVTVNAAYAEAIKAHQGAWVPSIVMGNNGQTQGSGAVDLINLLTAKAAKDLSLDMTAKMPVETAK